MKYFTSHPVLRDHVVDIEVPVNLGWFTKGHILIYRLRQIEID